VEREIDRYEEEPLTRYWSKSGSCKSLDVPCRHRAINCFIHYSNWNHNWTILLSIP